MKLINNLQLALLALLLTDIATFDYTTFKSKKLTEGTCPRKKCILQKCASGIDEPSTCERSDCPIRLASCGIKEKACSACVKEKPSCQPKEPNICPFCGQEICPQQQNPNCPPPKSGCPQEKPSGCPGQQQPSCPHQKPSCQSQKSKPGKPPKSQPKPTCRGHKSNCPQSAKSKCPQQSKPSCPNEKPSYPERCSLFRNFSFPSVMSTKKGETTKVEHKGKCSSNCPDGDACKGKPVK